MRVGGWLLLLLATMSFGGQTWAGSMVQRYAQLVSSKDPYIGKNNEKAALAWGASYQLLSYVVMFETTGQVRYLDRAVRAIDAILSQRDDRRKVKDYRGISTACWRNLHYQPKQEPYCYVVHSGMLTYPMARLCEALQRYSTFANQKAYDGKLYKQKSADYIARIRETIKAHADQWRTKGSSQGYYIFRNVKFMRFAGKAMPLNQQNALGRTLAVLARVTKNANTRSQAAKLCTYFKAYLKKQGNAYVWNYWPTTYRSPGEDISHAAINASFAVECAKTKAAFSQADLVAIAHTLFDLVYREARHWAGFVAGGAHHAKYAPQIGRWLQLAEAWPVIYGPIRTFYALHYGKITSASSTILLAHAYLAAYEPTHIHHDFYKVDWLDRTDHKQATAYGANLIAKPLDPKKPALIRLRYASYGALTLQQWDGKKYHDIQKFPNTAGKIREEWFVYDPKIWHAYYRGHALFQFKDARFVKGKGVKVWKQKPIQHPESNPEPRPEPRPEPLPEPRPEPLPERTPEVVAEPTPEEMPLEKIPEETTVEKGSELPEVVIESAPEEEPLVDGGNSDEAPQQPEKTYVMDVREKDVPEEAGSVDTHAEANAHPEPVYPEKAEEATPSDSTGRYAPPKPVDKGCDCQSLPIGSSVPFWLLMALWFLMWRKRFLSRKTHTP